MKKSIVPVLLIVTALFSCSKHDSGEDTLINSQDLPKSVDAFISNNYPAEAIYQAYSVSGKNEKYLVILSSDEDLVFDHNGSFIGEGEQYADSGHHHKKHHHGIGHIHFGIPVDSLAASITGYVGTNFPGYKIKHAETDSLCSYGLVTELMILNNGTNPLKLYFSQNEVYLMQGTRILSSTLPDAVKTALASHYPGYSLTEKSEKYILADNYTVEYIAFLTKDDARKRVIIREDGNEVCNQ